MAETSHTIGFVGLGRMGGNMAARLLERGHTVCGTARSREHLQGLLDNGLLWLDTAAEVAERADVIVTSLPDDEALLSVASELLDRLGAGKTWIDVSTVSPRVARDLAQRVRERGATLLSAPVSGSVPQVQAGTLTIIAGGDEQAFTEVEPILRELGTARHVGDNAQALTLKLAVNISLGVQMLAFDEGLLLALRSGIDSDTALDVMSGSAIGSPMLKTRAPIILDPPPEAWFDFDFMRKDIELALDTGRELGVPLPSATRADEVLHVGDDLGYGTRDIAALYEVLQQMPPA